MNFYIFSPSQPFISFYRGGSLGQFVAHTAPSVPLSVQSSSLVQYCSLYLLFALFSFLLPLSLCFSLSSHILREVSTIRNPLFDCPPASFRPVFIKHISAPLLCAGSGAARQFLYFSGSSDGGRPAHSHLFSCSAVLLRKIKVDLSWKMTAKNMKST